MDLGVISVRYARALLKGALAEKQEDELYKEMQILYKSYLEVPELRTTIDNPMLAKEKNRRFLKLLVVMISLISQSVLLILC